MSRGELLEASQANYSDSIDLGLTCPLCGKPVFLVKEAVRQRGERLEYIQPHFSHYKADSEAGKLCEARILTKEGKEFLAKLSPESRGQRLSLFNKRLWAMIAWEKHFPKDLDKWLKRNSGKHYNDLPQLIDHCFKHWQDPVERQEIKKALPETIKVLTETNFAEAGIDLDQNKIVVQEVIRFMQDDLNRRLQWLIAEEVVDYLAQDSAKPVFGNLVRVALFDALPTVFKTGQPVHSNSIMYLILCSVGLTRWEAALEKFKTAQPGEGFSPKR